MKTWTKFQRGVLPKRLNPLRGVESVWLNNRYQVEVSRLKSNVADMPDMTCLSIKHLDKSVVRDWRDLQRIKNEILGPEWEGVELFPAESRLVDTSNQYWLWCVPPPMTFPFGFSEGRLVSEVEVTNPHGGRSRQRPFDVKPDDLEKPEDVRKRMDEAGLTEDAGWRVTVADGTRGMERGR